MGKGNKRKTGYHTLISKISDELIPVKLRFIEETAKELNEFLVTLQISFPMLPWLVPLKVLFEDLLEVSSYLMY